MAPVIRRRLSREPDETTGPEDFRVPVGARGDRRISGTSSPPTMRAWQPLRRNRRDWVRSWSDPSSRPSRPPQLTPARASRDRMFGRPPFAFQPAFAPEITAPSLAASWVPPPELQAAIEPVSLVHDIAALTSRPTIGGSWVAEPSNF